MEKSRLARPDLSRVGRRRIVRVDLKSELFACQIDEQTLTLTRTIDGELLLVTNINDLGPRAIESS